MSNSWSTSGKSDFVHALGCRVTAQDCPGKFCVRRIDQQLIDCIKIEYSLLGGALGAERTIVQRHCFSWETPRQYNFESANFIAEKYCCHCAGS